MTISEIELKRYLWGAAVVLRGIIDPSDYKSIIFPLMFFKRLSDVYDEEYRDAMELYGDKEAATFKENHAFRVPDGCHWTDIRKATTNVGHTIKMAMTNIEKANPERLYGVFGDTNWTNKERLPDRTLVDLIEHFSQVELSTRNVSYDEFGNAYEYLIKEFADDSGHTAAEFYTNRTVVSLMTLIVDPHPGESIYDPTCGSGGMLLNARLLLKARGKEYRSLKLFGQEINIITSSIARINMFIHGVQDFEIIQGDTLKMPAFTEYGRIKRFDICLANPPYSIKKWNRESWKHDPWSRNKYGTPPQGFADYAFFQHILCSLKEDTGRCAILFPHGILVRDAEQEMRKAILEDDLIECIIGLGEGLFYNSAMEACVVICRMKKSPENRGKVLFIDAKDEIRIERTQSFLDEPHIRKILEVYNKFQSILGFSKVASIEEIRNKEYSLNIKEYVADNQYVDEKILETPASYYISEWKKGSLAVNKSLEELTRILEQIDNK